MHKLTLITLLVTFSTLLGLSDENNTNRLDDTILFTGLVPAESRDEYLNVGREYGPVMSNKHVEAKFILHVGRPGIVVSTPRASKDQWALVACPNFRNLTTNTVVIRCYVSFYDKSKELLASTSRSVKLSPEGGQLTNYLAIDRIPYGLPYAYVPRSVSTNVCSYTVRIYTTITDRPNQIEFQH